MRASLLLCAAALIYSAASNGSDRTWWSPSADQIGAFEAQIDGKSMPLGGLDRYARYYSGVFYGSRMFIRAKFVPLKDSDTTAIHVVAGEMPPLQGEGCVGSLVASVEPGHRAATVFLRCAHPGAWTPTAAQISDLEKQLDGISDRARHYAGVTIDGRQIIKGVLLRGLPGEKPGVYVASEAELPLIADGGCSVINVDYDPVTQKLSHTCNGYA
jgi:hypothetical protein